MKNVFKIVFSLILFSGYLYSSMTGAKKLAYIVSDTRIPFWSIMAKGIKESSQKAGFEIEIYSSNNIIKNEVKFTAKVIKEKVDGLIISPINSSSSVTILKLAKKANIPVVIADIGTNKGEYLSYISSDNEKGAYDIGKVLARTMIEKGYQKGKVGIIAIPQKRENGKLRTKGFMKALRELNIKGADIKQQVTFSYKETFDFSKELIDKYPDLRAIWLQGSDRYQGALDAIEQSGKKGEILLICFDAEPVFLELIPKGILVGAAMQQPFLMGEKAVEVLTDHFKGKDVKKKIMLSILAIDKANIEEKLPIIKRNVLGEDIK